jgi:predicted  nucleic acid-binding Zn-ribbon protein
MTTKQVEEHIEKLTGEISKLKSRCTKLENKLKDVKETAPAAEEPKA